MSTRLHVFDKYEVIRRIASGGMGDIFLARQTGAAGFNRLVVLKSLRTELAEREDFLSQFLNEARTAAKLNHPNVVAVYDVDEYRGVYFLAMEYIKGADLSGLLSAAHNHGQRIPFRFAATIVHDAALGLLHAHRAADEKGAPLEILHRDVSVQNLMVRLDGLTKVVDFGIALAKADQVSAKDNKVQGKLRYLAPEQLKGQPLDGRTDQYALGIVLYELLTQRRPFAGGSPREIFEKILSGACAPISEIAPDVPAELEAVVGKMMARNRDQRFPSLAEVAEALGQLRNQGPPVEPLLAKLVVALVGKEVQSRTQNLTPEPVTISGLLETADTVCGACGARNPLRHRFCRDCGASLGGGGAEERRAALPASAGKVPRLSGAIGARLLAEAKGLGALLDGEIKKVFVLAGCFGLVPGKPRSDKATADLERHRWLESVAELGEAAGASIVRLTAEELCLVFGAQSAARANEAWAFNVAAGLLRSLAESEWIRGSLAVDEGDVRVAGPERGATGQVVEDARSLAARAFDADQLGLFVSDRLATRLERRALISTVPIEPRGDRAAFRLVRVDGFRETAPTPETPLVGRRNEIVRAQALLGRALVGHAGGLAFGAEPGLGKSRLLLEIERLAGEKGFARLSIDGTDPALQAEGAFLRRLTTLALRALDAPEGGQDRPSDKVSLLGMSDSARLRLLAALGFGPSDEDRAGAEHRLRDDAILIQSLLEIADLAPLCILVDELQSLPPSAIALFDQWERRAKGSRVAAFATLDRTATSALALSTEVLLLSPLEDDKLLALTSAHLGAPLPHLAAQRLLEAADGSPSLAVQIATAMIDLGGLGWVDDRLEARPSLFTIELPQRVEELVGLRLQQLSKPARSFLKVAAVAGNIFGAETIAAALGIDAEAVVAECLGLRLLERPIAHGDLLGFRQARIRRVLLDRASAADLRKINLRLAEVLTLGTDPADPESRQAIARHLLDADAGARAVEAAVEAATLSPTAPGSIELYRRGARMLVERPEIVEGLSASARVALVEHGLPQLGATSLDLLESATLVLVDTVQGSSFARLLLHRGAARLRKGRLEEALADVERARSLDALDPSLRAELLACKGCILEANGRLAEATSCLAEALALVEGVKGHDPHFYWQQSNALGRLYFKMGAAERAMTLFEIAAREAEIAGSALGQAQALTNLAALLGSEARHREALDRLAEARTLAEAAADPITLAKIAYNRGRIELGRDDPTAAKGAFEEAGKWALRVDWQEGVALAAQALRAL